MARRDAWDFRGRIIGPGEKLIQLAGFFELMMRERTGMLRPWVGTVLSRTLAAEN